jgi:hypothetical protein
LDTIKFLSFNFEKISDFFTELPSTVHSIIIHLYYL